MLSTSLDPTPSENLVHVQEKEVLEAQEREQWVPRVGSNVYVLRMNGNFKVSCGLSGPWCSKPREQGAELPFNTTRSMPDRMLRTEIGIIIVWCYMQVVSVKGDQVNVQLGALKVNVALNEIRRQS